MLLGKNDSTLSFPDYDDKSLLVNDISRFFVRKIIRIRDQIDSTVIADVDTVPCNPIVSGTDESTRPAASCFYCFEVFGTPDETRSTSFWYSFLNELPIIIVCKQ